MKAAWRVLTVPQRGNKRDRDLHLIDIKVVSRLHNRYATDHLIISLLTALTITHLINNAAQKKLGFRRYQSQYLKTDISVTKSMFLVAL